MSAAAMMVAAALAALMLAFAIADRRCYRVPDPLTMAALAPRGLALFGLSDLPDDDLLAMTIRAAAMTGLFYGFRLAYRGFRGREGLGLGDVKLAAVAGALMDWRLLPLVVELAALAGLAIALVRVARSGAGLRAESKLAFAVGFAAAIFVGWQLQTLGL